MFLPSKQTRRVRFPLPAPKTSKRNLGGFLFPVDIFESNDKVISTTVMHLTQKNNGSPFFKVFGFFFIIAFLAILVFIVNQFFYGQRLLNECVADGHKEYECVAMTKMVGPEWKRLKRWLGRLPISLVYRLKMITVKMRWINWELQY